MVCPGKESKARPQSTNGKRYSNKRQKGCDIQKFVGVDQGSEPGEMTSNRRRLF